MKTFPKHTLYILVVLIPILIAILFGYTESMAGSNSFKIITQSIIGFALGMNINIGIFLTAALLVYSKK